MPLPSARHFLAVLLAVALTFTLAAPTASAQPEEMPLGSSLPSVDAPMKRVDGSSVSVPDLLGAEATVFVFWSNQCPWVDKYEDRVQAMVEEFGGQGVRFVLVNANDDAAFPGESLQASRERAESAGYEATYVRDPTAALAQSLGASRTPHVFLFDDTKTLVYAGTIDDSPADPDNVSKPYLQNAITAVLGGESVPVADTKAFGCMLKYP
jgi:thiol-disulfide isomerase/thioredoxin